MNEIINASFEALKKSLGIFSKQEIQSTAEGTSIAVTEGIDNIKTAGKYFLIGGVIVTGLIIYSKLK